MVEINIPQIDVNQLNRELNKIRQTNIQIPQIPRIDVGRINQQIGNIRIPEVNVGALNTELANIRLPEINVNQLNRQLANVKIPEINVEGLNRELGGILEKANIEGLQAKAQQAIKQFEAVNFSKLSTELGKVASGFESLTQELDDIEGLDELQKVATQGVAVLKQNAPGLKQIAKEATAITGELNKLAGRAVEAGLLDFKVTAPTPQAISKALEELTGEPLEKVSQALGEVSLAPLADLAPAINDVVGKALPIGNEFLGEVTKFSASLEAEIGNLKNGFTGQLKNLSENLNGQLGPALNKITDGNIKVLEQLKPQVAQLLESNELAKASELLRKHSTLPLSEIESKLSSVPVTMAEKVARDIKLPTKATISRIIGG